MTGSPAPLVLYTTSGCHLCEQARQLVEEELARPENTGRWQLVSRDIADDETLMERYGIRIPVVRRADDDEELGWPFDGQALAAFLAGG